ncbi:MAG TPA: T9SS type A sorting domain-containing protein, partial [Ferruginibacter sp.]|nr:T9SS type A sorting domain-containing protein [Ferruginibacter sp.]
GQILSLYKHNTNTNNGAASVATAGFFNAAINSTSSVVFSSVPTPFQYGITAPAGPYKPDALNGAIVNPGYTIMDPTGFASNAANFAALYSVPNGAWTLALADGGPGDLGTLTSWSISITHVLGTPATPATWSPIAGLFNDANATIAYAGTPRDTVWAKPTPSGVYPYTATVNSLGGPASNITTTFTNNNAFGLVIFNIKNNNAFPITITGIESIASTSGPSTATVYYKTTPINGAPGAISAANGWVTSGTGSYTAIANLTTTTPQPFLSGLTLSIPAGATYGVAVESKLTATNVGNLRYSTIAAGIQTISSGGVDFITGTNIGYAGDISPAVLANTPRGFIGIVRFQGASGAPCTSAGRTVIVTVNEKANILPQDEPVNATTCTDKIATFTVKASTGTGPFTYRWEVSALNGNPNTWFPVNNGGVYSGATTATLTLTAPPVTMNGYLYRAIVNGAAPCASDTSAQRLLTVNPLPVVTITANPYTSLLPGLTTRLTSTVGPNAAGPNGYVWLRNGVPVVGANLDRFDVTVDNLGDFSLRVTDVNGCVGTSNVISIRDSVSGKCFIYPNPNSGRFEVRYYSTMNNVGLPRTLTVFDSKGERVLSLNYTIGRPYDKMKVDLSAKGKGIYWVEVGDANGNRLTMCRVVIQ